VTEAEEDHLEFNAELAMNLVNIQTYMGKLNYVVDNLPKLFSTMNLNTWKSLIINRRKPHTYRVFKQFGDYRICLHKFEGCDEHEAFLHPHPWPGAFCIIHGMYMMNVGYSATLDQKTPWPVYRQLQVPGSRYEIVEPKAWHSVIPVGGEVFTIMLNGVPWKAGVHHESVVTTKGKDLQTMTESELADFVTDYRKKYEASKNLGCFDLHGLRLGCNLIC
jgi:hypothetical protein